MLLETIVPGIRQRKRHQSVIAGRPVVRRRSLLWNVALFLCLFSTGMLGSVASAQTNPTPQALPYTQDFSGTPHTSTTYPAGWQGWTVSTSPGAAFNTAAPTGNAALVASSTAAVTSGNSHNYNGKIGFLNSASLDLTEALAVNTTGLQSIQVSYDVMTIRNPYDGGTNTRINEVTLQYRVGTSGTFTNLTGIEYQNNTTLQTGAVTTPQNLLTKVITLPAACDNQGVVQLRWASRQVSGAGSRPSFAFDNISVTGSPLPGTLSYRSGASGNWNAAGTWQVSTDNGGTWAAATSTPTSANASVSILSPHTVTVTTGVAVDEVTVASGGTLAVSGGVSLTVNDGTGTDLTVNGTLATAGTINGAGTIAANGGVVRIDEGGWGGNTNSYSYDATGVLVFNNTSGPYGVNSDAVYWPNPITNVTVQGAGGILMNVARSVTGTFQTASGVSNAASLTLAGTVQINAGGYFGNAPVYSGTATLVYNSGGSYAVGSEWTGNGATGSGIPQHVLVQNGTAVTLPASDRGIPGNFTITNGSVTLNGASGDLYVGGNWTRNTGGTFAPSNRAVFFNGTGPQTLTGATAFDYLLVNKSSGTLTLADDITVNQGLTLTNGVVATGPRKIALGASAFAARTNGYVNGSLEKLFAAGTQTFTYPIGTATTFAPVLLGSFIVTAPGTVTASTADGDHGGIASSGLDPAKSVNRSWTLTKDAGLAFTSYDPTFTFASGDLDAGAATGAFRIKHFNGSTWSSTLPGTRTSLSTQATGVTSFSDFIVGEPATHTITASAGAGGSITPSGSVSVADGSDTTFTVTATAGYHIDSVVVDGTNLGAIGSHGFTNVTADHVISAYFSIDTYVITATAGLNGSISPSGAITVNSGTDQTFTLSADPGYMVDSLIVDGVDQGAITSYTFLAVAANHTIRAVFEPSGYVITASAVGAGGITPSGSVGVPANGSQAFTIAPDPGNHIDSVVVDGVNQGAIGLYTFSSVMAGHSIVAYFSVNTYTITASASAGGSITPSGAVTVTHGSSQTFTISANAGYHIDSVVVDGGNLGPIGSHTFTGITAGHTIASFFSLDTYIITATIAGNGSIVPAGAVPAAYGTDTTFTVTPAANHHVDSLVVDGVNLGPQTIHSFTNITASHTIAAYVSIDTWTITAAAVGTGSILPGGVVIVPHGSDTTFAITPAVGSHIDSVVVDGANIGAVPGHTFTGVTGAHTITAYFSVDMFTITATAGPNGSITPSGAVPAGYGSTPSFTVTPDSGYHVDSVLVDGVDQGPVPSYTFPSIAAGHTIAAFFSINTYTLTATADPGGSIAPSGTVNVTFGGTQAFTATPDSGYMVDSLVVDGVDQGPLALYTFTGVAANHSIHASFAPAGYIITAAAVGGGSLTPSGAVIVPNGGSQVFNVLPDTGYHIDSVVVDGTDQGVVPSYTFSSVIAPHTITAYFSVNLYSIVATVNGNGTIAPADTVAVAYGSTPAFTITPAAGHHIDSVLVDGVSQGATGVYTFAAIDTSHVITAYFSINLYTVTAAVSGNGSIAPAGAVVLAWGTNQTFTITPDSGYHVDSVLVDGVDQGALPSWTVTAIDTNHAITAYFSINTYPVVATAVGNGSITPSGTVLVPLGGSQSFTVTPDTGYHIDSVVVDGVAQGVPTSYTFTAVDTAHAITAYFSINYYTITTAVVGNGTINPAGTVTLAYGTDTTVTVTPDVGYHVDSLVVDGVNSGPLVSYAFVGLDTNHTVTAYISINVYAVTAIAGTGGTISPSGVVPAAYGGTLTFTITPGLGRHIDSVLVDGVNQGPVTGYTFLNIVANHTIRAWFSIDFFTITATAGPQGVIVPSGVISLPYGSSRTFAITPQRGYGVLDVLVDSVSVGAVRAYTFTNLTASHRIDVSFKQVNVFLTLTADSMLARHPVTRRYWLPAKRYRGQYPNWTNLLSELVYQGGFQPGATESDGAGGMLLGVSYMFPVTPTIWKPIRDSAATMAWVRLTGWDLKKNIGKSYTSLLKSLEDKTGRHDGEPRGLDYQGQPGQEFRPLLKQLLTLPPRKQDNALIGELIALKVNIAASQLGKTPPGFGELIYVNEGHPCDGMSIVAISAKTDTALTRWREYDDSLYTELYDAVYDINRAFVAPIDTFLFNNGGQLVLDGQVDVADVPFLRRDSTVAPRRLVRTTDLTEGEEEFDDAEFEDGVPVAAKMYQNYPNPFNPSTTINFRLREPSLVTIAVYNMLGQQVARLLEGEELEEGYQTMEFIPNGLASGVYFCRIDVQGLGEAALHTAVTGKMLLLK